MCVRVARKRVEQTREIGLEYKGKGVGVLEKRGGVENWGKEGWSTGGDRV